MEYPEDLREAQQFEAERAQQNKNKEQILAKNLAVLSSVDLLEKLNENDLALLRYKEMILDLLDILQLDDSIIMRLSKLGDDVTLKDLEDIDSVVRDFNINGKFMTLAKFYEKELKEILGEDSFNSKLRKSKGLRKERNFKKLK